MAKTDKKVEPITSVLNEYHFAANNGKPATVIHAPSYLEALSIYQQPLAVAAGELHEVLQ